MKAKDIKRLEKAAVYYGKILDLLDAACESVLDDELTGRFKNGKTIHQEVLEMYHGALNERKWLMGKIHAFKELSNEESQHVETVRSTRSSGGCDTSKYECSAEQLLNGFNEQVLRYLP